VHSHQRGFCVVAGSPGTGKTVLRKAFAQSGDRRVCPHITRTMHTYSNTLRILCASLAIEYEGGDLKCEKQVIEQAHALHRQGKAIALTIDDAHLMPPVHLRKLRLLLEDTPGNYGIILFAQTELLARLALAVNEDLQSRVSFSALLQALTPEDIEAFILREFDRCGLPHSRLDTAALHLIAASSGGILRHAVNLTTASLVQAVRTQTTTVTTAHVNTALMQPHWRDHDHWITTPDDA
jgi:type II secretory pathway predicted ATPase ExeA